MSNITAYPYSKVDYTITYDENLVKTNGALTIEQTSGENTFFKLLQEKLDSDERYKFKVETKEIEIHCQENAGLETSYNTAGNLNLMFNLPANSSVSPNYLNVVVNSTLDTNDTIMKILTNWIKSSDLLTEYYYPNNNNFEDNVNGVPLINLETAIKTGIDSKPILKYWNIGRDKWYDSQYNDSNGKPTINSISKVVEMCNAYAERFNSLIDYIIKNDVVYADDGFRNKLLELFGDGKKHSIALKNTTSTGSDNKQYNIYSYSNGTLMLPSLVNYIADNVNGKLHALAYCGYVGKESKMYISSAYDDNGIAKENKYIEDTTGTSEEDKHIYANSSANYNINGNMIHSSYNHPLSHSATASAPENVITPSKANYTSLDNSFFLSIDTNLPNFPGTNEITINVRNESTEATKQETIERYMYEPKFDSFTDAKTSLPNFYSNTESIGETLFGVTSSTEESDKAVKRESISVDLYVPLYYFAQTATVTGYTDFQNEFKEGKPGRQSEGICWDHYWNDYSKNDWKKCGWWIFKGEHDLSWDVCTGPRGATNFTAARVARDWNASRKSELLPSSGDYDKLKHMIYESPSFKNIRSAVSFDKVKFISIPNDSLSKWTMNSDTNNKVNWFGSEGTIKNYVNANGEFVLNDPTFTFYSVDVRTRNQTLENSCLSVTVALPTKHDETTSTRSEDLHHKGIDRSTKLNELRYIYTTSPVNEYICNSTTNIGAIRGTTVDKYNSIMSCANGYYTADEVAHAKDNDIAFVIVPNMTVVVEYEINITGWKKLLPSYYFEGESNRSTPVAVPETAYSGARTNTLYQNGLLMTMRKLNRSVYLFNENVFGYWMNVVYSPCGAQFVLNKLREYIKNNLELVMLAKASIIMAPYAEKLMNKIKASVVDYAFVNIPFGPPLMYSPKPTLIDATSHYGAFNITPNTDFNTYDNKAHNVNIINKIDYIDETNNILDLTIRKLIQGCMIDSEINDDTYFSILIPTKGLDVLDMLSKATTLVYKNADLISVNKWTNSNGPAFDSSISKILLSFRPLEYSECNSRKELSSLLSNYMYLTSVCVPWVLLHREAGAPYIQVRIETRTRNFKCEKSAETYVFNDTPENYEENLKKYNENNGTTEGDESEDENDEPTNEPTTEPDTDKPATDKEKFDDNDDKNKDDKDKDDKNKDKDDKSTESTPSIDTVDVITKPDAVFDGAGNFPSINRLFIYVSYSASSDFVPSKRGDASESSTDTGARNLVNDRFHTMLHLYYRGLDAKNPPYCMTNRKLGAYTKDIK